MIVPDTHLDIVSDALVARLEAITVGHPADDATDMGALVGLEQRALAAVDPDARGERDVDDEARRERVHARREHAAARGADARGRGRRGGPLAGPGRVEQRERDHDREQLQRADDEGERVDDAAQQV